MDGMTDHEEITDRDQQALAVGMHRACFLCGCIEGEQLFEEEWEIIGIGSTRLGIRICSECGLVLQDPVVPPSVMFRYYEQVSNYTNPGRSGLPTNDRITAVDRQLAVLNRNVKVQGMALQVGSADGYTLHRFKQAGWSVAGIDPSPAAAEVAKSLWGLRTDVGVFEDYRPQGNTQYNLIVLTHILEHIYDPVKMLRKCRSLLHSEGHLLIEVPVIINSSSMPPGYFTFEHINHFSVQSMANLLNLASLEPVDDFTISRNTYDPVMTCVARLLPSSIMSGTSIKSDYTETHRICSEYMAREPTDWRRIEALLAKGLRSCKRLIIWGAGIHTSQLLVRTDIRNYSDIDYIVDSDPRKWSLMLGKYAIKGPDEIPYDDEDLAIVISSICSEAEIYRAIASRPNLRVTIIRLYGDKEKVHDRYGK